MGKVAHGKRYRADFEKVPDRALSLKEAVDILNQKKMQVNLLHLNELWPFPARPVQDFLREAKKSFVVESNATGQLASLIRQETGKETGKILKFDGRPISPAFIVQAVEREGN